MEYVYRFPVVRGIQAESEYYIAMVPLKMLAKLFPVEDEEFVLQSMENIDLKQTRIMMKQEFLKYRWMPIS